MPAADTEWPEGLKSSRPSPLGLGGNQGGKRQRWDLAGLHPQKTTASCPGRYVPRPDGSPGELPQGRRCPAHGSRSLHRPSPIDVFRGLDYSPPGVRASLSAEQGVLPIDIPAPRTF